MVAIRQFFSRAVVAAYLFVALSGQAPAATREERVVGLVVSDGKPVVAATIVLAGTGGARTAVSDSAGRFSFPALPGGTYLMNATAAGYSPLSGRTVVVVPGGETTLDVRLIRAQASSLVTIGSVTSNGGQSLSTSAGTSTDLNAQNYARQGVIHVSDMLEGELSTTVVRAIGGGLNAPAVVALRGPDPAETLIDIDGHQVNNGNTGDFDMSLLDPADLQSVQTIYGIAPSSLLGPNTIGGAINVRTLEPTVQPHVLERLTGGTFGTYGATLQTTGTSDRLGYALSLHRVTSAGQLSQRSVTDGDGDLSTVGNGLSSSSAIAKLRYSLARGQGFVGVSLRDQSVNRDISGTLTSLAPNEDGVESITSFAGSNTRAHNAAYGLDLQLPLGPPAADGITPTTMLFRHQTSLVSQSVFGPGAETSPYLYNNRDIVADDTLQFDRQLPHGTLSLKLALTSERLDTDLVSGVLDEDSIGRRFDTPVARALSGMRSVRTLATTDENGLIVTREPLAQTQRSAALRYTLDPTSKLHYSLATYVSNYSTSGGSLNPRFGFVWTPKAESAFRVSLGTSFESPQLPSLLVPENLPAPVNGYVTIGNPSLTAERAIEMSAGYEHVFRLPLETHVSLDLYRTDLHNGIVPFFSPTQCVPEIDYGNFAPCLSYPINVATKIYQGAEFRTDVALSRTNALHVRYDVNSSFTQASPASIENDLVPGQQSLGVPLHKFTIDFAHDARLGLSYSAGLLYEGRYNELNLPPYATLHAGATWHFQNMDVGLYGTNLTNANNFLYTRVGGGLPYGSIPGVAPLATSAYPLGGRQVILSITHRT